MIPMMMKWDMIKKGYYREQFAEWVKAIGNLNR